MTISEKARLAAAAAIAKAGFAHAKLLLADVALEAALPHLTLLDGVYATLATIADIAEGSRTLNSLPHIARLARGACACLQPGGDPSGNCEICDPPQVKHPPLLLKETLPEYIERIDRLQQEAFQGDARVLRVVAKMIDLEGYKDSARSLYDIADRLDAAPSLTLHDSGWKQEVLDTLDEWIGDAKIANANSDITDRERFGWACNLRGLESAKGLIEERSRPQLLADERGSKTDAS